MSDGTAGDELELLREHIRRAQALDWSSLADALREAINGTWSIRAGNICVQIVAAARLVGVTPWGEVSVDLVFGGVYEAVCEVGGLVAEVPDEAETALTVELFVAAGRRGLDPDALRVEMAATVAAIRSPRESAFIRDGQE